MRRRRHGLRKPEQQKSRWPKADRMDRSKKQWKTIDEYIETFPKDVQGILQRIRLTIRKAAPEAVETISYQMPTFKLNGKGVVYCAAYENHSGFYRIPCGMKAFAKESPSVEVGKGSV